MVVIVMGVAGSGKSTIERMLAGATGMQFLDADDLHSAANRSTMRRGIALSDKDRRPWFTAVHAQIESFVRRGVSATVACRSKTVVSRAPRRESHGHRTRLFEGRA